MVCNAKYIVEYGPETGVFTDELIKKRGEVFLNTSPLLK